MPYMQSPVTPMEHRGVPAYGDSFHPPVPDATSSTRAPSPLEALGDFPSRQVPCRLEELSAYMDTFVRARVMAAMTLDIFVHKTPRNPHSDGWKCSFSNCKQSFEDTEELFLHLAQCRHVSPYGVYCNCCGEYYNFLGNSRACWVSASDSVFPAMKTSTMAKGKRKLASFFFPRSGSASSSRNQLCTFGQRSYSCTPSGSDLMTQSPTTSHKGSTGSSATESSTCVRPLAELDNCHIVELDHSAALLNELDSNVRTQQRSTQSTISTLSAISTTGYMDSMSTDYGDFCMSPTEYSVPDRQHDDGTQTREAGISYASGGVAQHDMQTAVMASQNTCWNLGQQDDVPWDFGESAPSSQTAQGLEVVVPNFSHPLPNSPAGNSGDGGFNFLETNDETGIIASAEPQSRYSSGDSFDFLHHDSLGYDPLNVGIAVNSMESIGIAETNVETISPSLRRSTGSFISSGRIQHGDDMRCQESGCTYRPNGAEAHRQANLNKHMKHMHGDRASLPCEQCGVFFTRRDNLLAHQRDVQ
ncbi:hypothetical protein NW768_001106 [Fusarium equiseti]|uniref:C2H2-type domain-containing protein n=1 Tax=Fusarium equiseti TaxID=61235 RepID=A0ABQ8RPH4_FUSEQ|nr:hypothetical protein NW768_001106 [Fusarium equiseti]